MQVHQGQLLERVIRREGYSISEVARLTKVNRRSVYNWFRQETLRPEIICKIGLALGHDFSQEFPNLYLHHRPIHTEEKSSLSIQQKDFIDDSTDDIYWKDKYIDLLEKHNKLLLFLFRK